MAKLHGNLEEPMFITKSLKADPESVDLRALIAGLLKEEDFAVLATQGDEEPYTSLISHAISADLKTLFFATPHDTKKCHFIAKSSRVSLLVDTRSRGPGGINAIKTLMVSGDAHIIEDTVDRDLATSYLLTRHPYLKTFVHAPSTALVGVRVTLYTLVQNFQEVMFHKP